MNFNISKFSTTHSQEGFPLYTKAISDIASVYIKDGHVIKNRGDRNIIIKNEIENFNNIAIEKDRIVNIYCSEEMSRRYIEVADSLIKYKSNIKNCIKINIGRCENDQR